MLMTAICNCWPVRRKSGPGRAAAVEENDAWMDAYLKEMDAQ